MPRAKKKAVVIEYLPQGIRRQLNLFDAPQKRPATAAPATAAPAPATCYECGTILSGADFEIGICAACFSPRR